MVEKKTVRRCRRLYQNGKDYSHGSHPVYPGVYPPYSVYSWRYYYHSEYCCHFLCHSLLVPSCDYLVHQFALISFWHDDYSFVSSLVALP